MADPADTREPTADELIEQRFATQRLTAEPLDDPVEIVRLLLCVQAQDAPLARYSLGLRLREGDDATVRAAIDDGSLIRTHILRPTWHFVAADDLRWILELTSPKVESSLAGRHRRVGVDLETIDRAHGEIAAMLAGRNALTAPEIGDELAELGLEVHGATLRHLLLVAELRGLICSGPLRGQTHTYTLIDELIGPSQPLDRTVAIRRFVRRYFAGHGPASEQDLRRWTTLTLAEIRDALAELDHELTSIDHDGVRLWFDPDTATEPEPSHRRAAMLPTFDEAYLPLRSIEFARVSGHPRGPEPHVFGEAGGGVVIVDRCDAGWWKRTVENRSLMTVKLALASGLDGEQHRAVTSEASRLAAFFGMEAEIDLIEP